MGVEGVHAEGREVGVGAIVGISSGVMTTALRGYVARRELTLCPVMRRRRPRRDRTTRQGFAVPLAAGRARRARRLFAGIAPQH